MSTIKPWENLSRVVKVEIIPGPNSDRVEIQYSEDVEYENLFDSRVRPQIVSLNRQVTLFNEKLVFHYDYPDDFKKLVHAMNGDYPKAYEGYLALQKPVPNNWDVKISNPSYGEDSDLEREDEVYEW